MEESQKMDGLFPWKIRVKWMRTGGNPYDFGNQHMDAYGAFRSVMGVFQVAVVMHFVGVDVPCFM